ncbi:MAG: TOBE domain-containing protein [Oligoflexales bacterium]|nr:TOBE domain-containing protein [Oligoflexales bacterium]
MKFPHKTQERLLLDYAGRLFLDPRRISLLRKIDELGSINKAAKAVGITYKSAWDAISAINNLSNRPLVLASRGGAGGGGARLSETAKRTVSAYLIWERINARLRELLQKELDAEHINSDFFSEEYFFYNLFGRIPFMKTSARNNLCGKVTDVKRGAVNTEVIMSIDNANRVAAIITNDSSDSLGLKKGDTVYALFKASSVILLTDDTIKTSARNHFKGTIKDLQIGAVNSEVVIDIGDHKTLAAIITNQSVNDLGLKKGGPAVAIVKASSVIIAKQ